MFTNKLNTNSGIVHSKHATDNYHLSYSNNDVTKTEENHIALYVVWIRLLHRFVANGNLQVIEDFFLFLAQMCGAPKKNSLYYKIWSSSRYCTGVLWSMWLLPVKIRKNKTRFKNSLNIWNGQNPRTSTYPDISSNFMSFEKSVKSLFHLFWIVKEHIQSDSYWTRRVKANFVISWK